MIKVTDENTVEITVDRKGLDLILEAAVRQIEELCGVSLDGMSIHDLACFHGTPGGDPRMLDLETGELTIRFRRWNELQKEVMP